MRLLTEEQEARLEAQSHRMFQALHRIEELAETALDLQTTKSTDFRLGMALIHETAKRLRVLIEDGRAL